MTVLKTALTLAALNLAAGLWLLFQPHRTTDFERVVGWVRLWSGGVNPYALPDALVDYPPWALLVLWPLTLVPDQALLTTWVVANLALLGALAWRLTREVDEPTRVRLALVALLLATASARTWTQFSLVSYVLAVAGALSGTGAGAVAVGLALMKPQIGGVALAWMLLRRQWARAGLALLVPVVLTLLCAARLGTAPLPLLDQYAGIVTLVHGAAEPLEGHTELRAWLVHLWPAGATRLWTALALAIVLALPAVAFAARRRTWTADQSLEVLALCGAVSLLAFRHLSYDFILLWPAVVAWRRPPFSTHRMGQWGNGAMGQWRFLLLTGVLILGIPAWARLAVSTGAPPGLAVLTELDRITALAAWSGLSWRLLRDRAG